MNYQIVEKDNNQVLIYIVAIAVIFFMFILPKLEKCNAKEENEVKEKFEQLKFEEVENSKINKIDLKKRSKDCCLWEQWPVPHMPKKNLINILELILEQLVDVYVLTKKITTTYLAEARTLTDVK